MVRSFRDLHVWQKSMQLVTEVYRLIEQFPRREMYGLTSQIRRAAVSIPSNIAEGQARSSTRDFRQFLCVSRASNSELQAQIEISSRLGYITASESGPLLRQSTEIGKMLNSLITRSNERMGVANH